VEQQKPGDENNGRYRLEIINPRKGSRIYTYFQKSASANISVCQLEMRASIRKYVVHTRGGLRLKCDGTHAETRFRFSAKRTSPFKSARGGEFNSVQSTTGSRGVRISGSNGSNAGYTMLRGNVKGTDYPLHSPVSPSLPLPCVTVCHHISTGLYTYLLGEINCSHIPTGKVFGTQNIFALVFHFFTLSFFNGTRQTGWMLILCVELSSDPWRTRVFQSWICVSHPGRECA